MYTMLKPLREVIAHTYTSVISIYGYLLAYMYVEYSYIRIHIVVDVLAFRVKTVYIVYIYIVCIDYIDYIYKFCWLKLLRMYRHSFARRVQKRYAHACARKSQFFSTSHVRCNDIVRAVLR